MKDKGDHDTCSCVVDEAVVVSEVVDDEAVVCMHDLAVSEVKVDTMAISKVVDALAVDEGDDDEGVDDEVVDDAMGVYGGVDDAMVVCGGVNDAMVVYGGVDDARGVDEGVDDAMVVYGGVDDAMVVADAMVDDEEVVDEKLQLDVDTVVELHFHFLLLGIQSTENKRKCQKNVPGHCKFPHGTNRPIIKLDCTQGLSSFFHTSVYCKIPSKEYKQREWNGSVAKKSACQTRNPEVLGSTSVLGTCWICSQLSQVQIHSHWLPPAGWGF